MKILYIHQYFKTPEEGGAIRSYTIAKEMVEAGHTVIMITSHNKDKVVIKDIDGIRVHYLPVSYDNKMGIGRRLYSFYQFYKAGYKQAKMVADVDLIYATSTPLSIGLLARKLKLKLGLPYFFEVRDLWPDAPFELGPKIPSLIKLRVHQLERKVYEEAEQIIALSPAMEKRVKLRSPNSRITMVPNISDLNLFQPSRLWQTNPIQISYFGAVGKVNGLSDLMPIAKHCQDLSLPIQFNIYGTGSEQASLDKQAALTGCENLKLHGHLDKQELNTALQNTAIALISFADSPILETSSPNKFFDALAAGKMVVTNTGGWIKELIEQNRIGFFYDRQNPQDFVDQLMPYLNDVKRIEECQSSAHQLAEDRFSVDKLVGTLLETIKSSDKTVLKKMA